MSLFFNTEEIFLHISLMTQIEVYPILQRDGYKAICTVKTYIHYSSYFIDILNKVSTDAKYGASIVLKDAADGVCEKLKQKGFGSPPRLNKYVRQLSRALSPLKRRLQTELEEIS